MGSKKKEKPSIEDYLKEGKINKTLHTTISRIPNPDKKERVIETLHRRIAKRGSLA